MCAISLSYWRIRSKVHSDPVEIGSRFLLLAFMAWPSTHQATLEHFAEHRADVRGGHQLLLGEAVGEGLGYLFAPEPQRLVLTWGDLDVGEVLHERHDLVDQYIPAGRRVVVPVVTIRRLGGIDIPFVDRIALGHHFLH